MTPDQRAACLVLVRRPGGGRPLSPRRFRKRVGTRDGAGWAAAQVADAVEGRDEDDLELALVAAKVSWLDAFGDLLVRGQVTSTDVFG